MRYLQDQTIQEIPGHVTLECELSKAKVKMQWQKGSTPIAPGTKYTITADGTVHRLSISDVLAEDIAEYTAIARGKTSKCTLSIEGIMRVW